MDDWYNATVEDIYENGGKRVLWYFHGSPSSALTTVYPEHSWDMKQFKHKRRREETVVDLSRFGLAGEFALESGKS